MSEVAEVLNKAADVIEQRGLNKRSFAGYGPNCSFCAEGAIMYAAGFEPVLSGEDEFEQGHNFFSAEALDSRVDNSVVHKAIAALRRKVGGHVPDWNDKDETTQADVVRTLREVAANV